MIRIFHASDLHFGKPAVPEQIDAIERLIQEGGFTVVAISGDVTQRNRAGEFQMAARFLRDAGRVSKTIIVPGNHDVAWWKSPLKFRDHSKIYTNYKRYISEDLEPVLRVPGATLAGLNTSHGVTFGTLTWNLRDISIIGRVGKRQLLKLQTTFDESPPGDARVVVMHHNPVKGELSQRHGIRGTKKVLGAFAQMTVDVVLCGHDHQEAVHYIGHTKRGTVISTAGTVSNRSRGGRPSSVNVIAIDQETIDVTTLIWSSKEATFAPGPHKTFERHAHA